MVTYQYSIYSYHGYIPYQYSIIQVTMVTFLISTLLGYHGYIPYQFYNTGYHGYIPYQYSIIHVMDTYTGYHGYIPYQYSIIQVTMVTFLISTL